MYAREVPLGTIFYHGIKADLTIGDVIVPGVASNFVERGLKHVYFSANLEAATWGAELARGEGRARIFIVQPTGLFDDDPNLTDKRFPGNMTASYRSAAPLRIIGELDNWTGHTSEQINKMRENLARMKNGGTDTIIED